MSFPKWLRKKTSISSKNQQTQNICNTYNLNTVCNEAKCPNQSECFSRKTATFLALGSECTRNCLFCNISTNKAPKNPDPTEPARIALAIKELNLKHAVITMVTRDDLPDRGSFHIAKIIKETQAYCPKTTIEVLTSDFSGNFSYLSTVLKEKPSIFNHNIETTHTLSPLVRDVAQYERSLSVLKYAKNSPYKIPYIKSGLMVGLGETISDVKAAIKDLYLVGCDIVTIGQYLQPNKQKLAVKEFITPDQFQKYADYGHQLGIKKMICGPFVRSSYLAENVML